jgi:hypothetical protein
MLCVPTPRLALLHVAVLVFAAPAGSATAPQPVIVLPPSVKAMLPVGAVPIIVAVKVTLVPTTDGFAELANVAVLVALLTVCVSVMLVELLLPASPA